MNISCFNVGMATVHNGTHTCDCPEGWLAPACNTSVFDNHMVEYNVFSIVSACYSLALLGLGGYFGYIYLKNKKQLQHVLPLLVVQLSVLCFGLFMINPFGVRFGYNKASYYFQSLALYTSVGLLNSLYFYVYYRIIDGVLTVGHFLGLASVLVALALLTSGINLAAPTLGFMIYASINVMLMLLFNVVITMMAFNERDSNPFTRGRVMVIVCTFVYVLIALAAIITSRFVAQVYVIVCLPALAIHALQTVLMVFFRYRPQIEEGAIEEHNSSVEDNDDYELNSFEENYEEFGIDVDLSDFE